MNIDLFSLVKLAGWTDCQMLFASPSLRLFLCVRARACALGWRQYVALYHVTNVLPCSCPTPPLPSTPPQPTVNNPLLGCGVGGNTSLLLPDATCPPTNGCDPTNADAFHGSTCNQFCEDLVIGLPTVAGCCVLSYSCDAGPCAPAACCGFQACIPLIPENVG